VLVIISKEIAVFNDGADGAVKAFLVPVSVDLTGYAYRELRQQFGVGRLERVSAASTEISLRPPAGAAAVGTITVVTLATGWPLASLVRYSS